MALDDSWMAWAACRDYPQADKVFFPRSRRGVKPDTRKAKAICSTCVVRKTCLVYSIAHRISTGVWGGLSETERSALPREVKKQYKQVWLELHPLSSGR